MRTENAKYHVGPQTAARRKQSKTWKPENMQPTARVSGAFAAAGARSFSMRPAGKNEQSNLRQLQLWL